MSDASLTRNSYLTAIVVTLLVLVVMLLGQFAFGYEFQMGWYIVLVLVVFVSSFLASNYFFGRFVYQKIKLIYKMIYRVKSPVRDKNKNRISDNVISLIESDVKNWSELNRREIDELRHKETYRKEFLGDVTHELKTPVYNIQGFLETLIDGGIHDEKVLVDYLQRASRNVDRLSKIIGEMDLISKMENERIHFDSEQFELNEMVAEIFQSIELRAAERKITLNIKESFKKDIDVLGDKTKIRQVISNIVVNSLKYGKEGGLTNVSFFDVDDKVLIEITDNGIGIDKEHLPHIFTRFYRADRDRSRETGGSGLGLAIVKHIVEGHNQTLNVRSTLGVGTTFGFTLQKA
jgi:two-component system, OmpR family, phosphate regulon sensor histidine kinase PhoR